jgi:hypothetical protein
MGRKPLTILALSGEKIQSFHTIGTYAGKGYSSQTFR